MTPAIAAEDGETGQQMAGFTGEDATMTNATLLTEAAARPAVRNRDRHATAIATEGLVRRFNGVAAVDGLDLTIHAGEIYGFLGPNGAGKSTTVRVLCTLLAPSGGRAVVAGHDVVRAPGQVRLQIGVALQDAALDDQQTGRELLALQ